MGRQLLILALAFGIGTGFALLLGAKNLGTAFGVGQLTFAAALVWVLMTDKPRRG
ncbi:MAG TPA: hypothetical protein VMS11_15515 [Solirubrobacterales bacterium]|nr:hypothetical protein [Solirubrobacterales bacterium]